MTVSTYEPIAIIGSGCRLPGGSTSPSKLWKLLREPKDLSAAIPTERFNPTSFYHPDGAHHGTTNVRNAYLLDEDPRCFDAQFFQTKPVEADAMDPQQRILLETVYEMIESAGLRISDLRGSDTAVYVGVMGADYNDLVLRDLNNIPTYTSTGTSRSILSNRISYFFDWHGPSLTIDTACSSSLVALHQAVQTLQNGSARMAVAAGANLILGPENFVAESKLNMLSPDGRSRMWDSSANGYARGDGFVSVMLKRLKDAIADGDDIESVIRGSGVNQDGRTKGITVPSSRSQEALIRQVYRAAGLDLRRETDRCHYFEAHGTGTPAGDPIEAAAIANVFGDPRMAGSQTPLFVGSIKTVVGHSEGAAGLAGLLKASLAVKHGVIPPNLHLRRLNPEVRPFYTGLMIPTTLTAWPTLPAGHPRRASVNSFGFGGTNAHVVIESCPRSTSVSLTHAQPSLTPFNFSAPTTEALERYVRKYVDHLKVGLADHALQDLAYTLSVRRSVFSSRLSITALSSVELGYKLQEALDSSNSISNHPQKPIESGGILGVFTGQGAQWVGMGRDLILNFSFASDTIDELDGYLRDLPDTLSPNWSLREELLAQTDHSRMSDATWAQPLCTAVQIMLVDLLRIAEIKLAAVVGHSSGEIAAAYAAGYISARSALYISFFRGLHSRLTKSPTDARGSMMAVGTTLEDAEDLCHFPELSGRISVAAVNSSTSITLSGDYDAIDLARKAFEDEGKFARVLKVNKAYHSHHMDPCSDSYISSLVSSKIHVERPAAVGIPWFSSVTGALVDAEREQLHGPYWNDNMVRPVLFSQAVGASMIDKDPYALVIEIGPHPALRAPTIQTLGELGMNIPPYKGMLERQRSSIETISEFLGGVWSNLGMDAVNFEAVSRLYNTPSNLLKDLPSFPWDHRRKYWHESQQSAFFRTNATAPHALLGTLQPDCTEQEQRWRNVLSIADTPWLQNHKLEGIAVFPAAGYVAMALEASKSVSPSSTRVVEVRDLEINRPLTFDDETTNIETLFSLTGIRASSCGKRTSANFKCFAVPRKGAANMVMVACGSLSIKSDPRLPARLAVEASDPPRLVDLDVERLYHHLSDIGYEYTGPFRGLSATKRRFGTVKGLLRNPWSSSPHDDFLVHPALLDCTFQALFLAYSWPGDGMLSSMYVPRRIGRIVVDMKSAQESLKQDQKLPMGCTLSHSSSSALIGEIFVYPPRLPAGSDYAIIQVQGLELAPVSGPSPNEDRQLFQDVTWGVASPDARIALRANLTESLGSLAAQVAFRYPRMNILQVAIEDAGSVHRHMLELLGNAFLSYTIAVPDGCSGVAMKNQMNMQHNVQFISLDLDSESYQISQTSQYGLIIVSGLQEVISKYGKSLKNFRNLLQPGGYLVTGQSFDHVQPSNSWLQSMLCQNGFSGIDSIESVDGTSIWVSQAIDNRMVALRNPMVRGSLQETMHSVYVILGETEVLSSMVDELICLLRKHFFNVIVIHGIDSPDVDTIPPTAVIISLVDLGEPVFKHLTSEKLEGLKRLLSQFRIILWVTKGSMAEDPYANMIVGFGRTLLLEVPSLRLQFLDIDPTLLVRAESLVEILLRHMLSQKETHSSKGESDMLWTIEPELALNQHGSLMIPRIRPSRERNNRYNSGRREITKQVNLKTSTVHIEHQEASRSYILREADSIANRNTSDDCKDIDIVIRHATVPALKANGCDYVFLVLGSVASTGQSVVAISSKHGSRVSLHRDCCVPCPIGLSLEEEQTFLASTSWNFYASTLLSELQPGDVAIIFEPPRPLEAALNIVAGQGKININFLTTSRGPDTSPMQARWPHKFLTENSSSDEIRLALPKKISVLLICDAGSVADRDHILHRIVPFLPRFHRQINLSTLSNPYSTIDQSSELEYVQQKLQCAMNLASCSPHCDFVAIDANKTAQISTPDVPVIMDWTKMTMPTVVLEPVDKTIAFMPDKTYFLAGLAGDLGQSLAEWLIHHGAMHIVLTSRNPRIESAWLGTLASTGATVRVLQCDITDKSSLEKAVDEVRRTLPPIAGVANGAMVLDDTPVAEMTLQKMQSVLDPKVSGSMHLDQIFGDPSLDFFIFFSSVAAVVGNRGQSNYSAANAFMSTLAAQRRSRGLAASVIHIGAVVGTGYLTRNVSQSVQDYLRKSGYMWLSESDFHQVFAEGVLSSPITSLSGHEVMSGLRLTEAEETNAVWYGNAKFQDCVSNREAAAVKDGLPKQALPFKEMLKVSRSWTESQSIVRDAFLDELRRKLLLDADAPMLQLAADDLGIDSLNAISFRSWFSQELGVDVPVMRILGGATVEQIVDFVVNKLPSSLTSMQSGDSKEATGEGNSDDVTDAESSQEETTEFAEMAPSETTSNTSVEYHPEHQDESIQTFRATNSKLYPLSFAQSRFWFLQSLLDDPTTSNVTCLMTIKGPLRSTDLARAVEALGDRHEALRTRFIEEHGKPWQEVLTKSSLRLEMMQAADDADVAKEFQKQQNHAFDLQSGHTMRITLLTHQSKLNYLIISYHHINMDGVSLMVLLRDLETFYVRQSPSDIVLQYPDYACEQLDAFETGKLAHQIAYWKREYRRLPPVLPILPMSWVQSRKQLKRHDTHNVKVQLDQAAKGRLQVACKSQGVTPFHFYLSVFNALLTRYSGAEDLSIGIAHAGRPSSKAFGSIGNFLNLLPLRLQSPPQASFLELLAEAKEKGYAALANPDVPIDTLFSELGVERSMEHAPLFQAFLDYRNVQEKQSLDDCVIEGQRYSVGRVAYDISLDVIDDPTGPCTLSMMVQKGLYDEEHATILLDAYIKLLQAFSQDVHLELRTPSMYSEAMLVDAATLGCGPPFRPKWDTLPHAVESICDQRPTSIALKDSSGHTLTYEDMHHVVSRISYAITSIGSLAGLETRVAVFQEPSVFWVCSMLAAMRAGAAYVPLDPRLGMRRIATILAEANVSVILAHTPTVDKISGLNAATSIRIIDIDSLPCSDQPLNVPNSAKSSSTGVILYTSGSTGTPKGVALPHYSLQSQMESCISKWHFEEEVVLQQSAYTFDFSVFQIYLALLTGGTCYVVSGEVRRDASAIVKTIVEEGVTLTGGVPSEYMTWLKIGDADALRASKYKTMVCGGETFSRSLIEGLQSLCKTDLRAMNIYGPSEVTIASNSVEVHYTDMAEHGQIPFIVGQPMPGYSVYVLDTDLKPVPAGSLGQVAVAGPISSGYINDDKLTAKRFIPCPKLITRAQTANSKALMHLTGDLGRIRPSDGALALMGRINGDTQVKLRGMRIDLQDVESTILSASHGRILTVAVSLRGESQRGFLVSHVTLCAKEHDENVSKYLQDLIAQLPLPEYMRPTKIIPVDSLPTTVSGKVDRKAIQQIPLEYQYHVNDAPQELGSVGQDLKQLWHQVLGDTGISDAKYIGADSDFFNVGGNSLLLMELQAVIQQFFSIKLPLLRVFEDTSLRGMANSIEAVIHHIESEQTEIDWEYEASLDLGQDMFPPSDIDDFSPGKSNDRCRCSGSRSVVLTGATGFLGRQLLATLLAKPDIARVYCIGTRSPEHLESLCDPRITIFRGDLRAPRLGLSLEYAQDVFRDVDTVIHNGADVSFLKTYTALRDANVRSTKDLMRMALRYNQHSCLSFHYISTVGIFQLHPNITDAPPTSSPFTPSKHSDGSNGYPLSKWVSERYLERLMEHVKPRNNGKLQVAIHRPSTITSPGIVRSMDIMQNLLGYCEQLRAVPSGLEKWWKGWIDLVDVERVAEGVVQSIIAPASSRSNPLYMHHANDHQIPIEGLKFWLEEQNDGVFSSLPRKEWIKKAREAGMSKVVAVYMESLWAQSQLSTPRILVNR